MNISYKEVLDRAKRLSKKEKRKLVTELQNEIPEKKIPNELQKILLNGPTWTDEDYNNYLRTREQLNNFPNNDLN